MGEIQNGTWIPYCDHSYADSESRDLRREIEKLKRAVNRLNGIDDPEPPPGRVLTAAEFLKEVYSSKKFEPLIKEAVEKAIEPKA